MGKRNLGAFKLLAVCGCSFMLTCLLGSGVSHAATLIFSGHTWNIKSGPGLGPGPNDWSEQNAWVDTEGNLHLKISYASGEWRCAEVWTEESFGFGRYEWYVDGRIDSLDRNVVFGMFNYGGSDGFNEIDIEFAKWGKQKGKIGHYTVFPAQAGLAPFSYTFGLSLTGTATTHRFTWTYDRVMFQSLQGWQTGDSNLIYQQTYAPSLYGLYIPQTAMPVHINLWLYNGRAPSNGKPVEVVIRKFSFTQL